MTTHVNPADGHDSLAYYKAYCLLLGELEHIAELSQSGMIFGSPTAIRMAAFYHGLLGLFDQAWKVESAEHEEIQEASLLGQLLSYGRDCFRQHARLTDERAAKAYMDQVDAAQEMVYLLERAGELARQLNPDKGDEDAVDGLRVRLPALVEAAHSNLRVSNELASYE